MSEQLGLLHVSKGEGCERHIQVFKAVSGQLATDTNRVNSATTANSLLSDANISDVHLSGNESDSVVMSSQVLDENDTDKLQLEEHNNVSRLSSVSAASNTDLLEQVRSNSLTETAVLPIEASSTVSRLNSCKNCGQQIPQANFLLHSLRCKSSVAKSSVKKNKDKSSNKVACLLFGISGCIKKL